MTQHTCTIGIDIGTTSAKVIAFTEDGACIAQHRCRLDLLQNEEGAAEQDIAAVYEAVMTALQRVTEQVREKGAIICQLGFSAAMHSLLLVEADGTPLTRAWTWMDTRAKRQADMLWASEAGQALYARTGTPIHPMSPVVKLLWWRQSKPDLLDRAAKWVSIKEWIWHQWFGEWVIDESMASATGMYNTKTRFWDTEALQQVGADEGKMSRIVPTTYVLAAGKSDALRSMQIPEEAVFNIGATDGVLANLGVGAMQPDALVITIGTSCALRITSAVPKTDTATRSFCYVLDQERYVLGGPSNSGGGAVEALYRQLLSGNGDASGLGAMLEAAGDVETGELICLPYVTGERAPLWNADAKAAWIGIGAQHTNVQLLRATVEGVLFNAYWIAAGLMELAGTPSCLLASGTLLELPWVRQVAADLFGLPVHFSHAGDASAVGAAWLAEIASGQRDPRDVEPDAELIEVTLPSEERGAELRGKFQQFKAYASLMSSALRIPK